MASNGLFESGLRPFKYWTMVAEDKTMAWMNGQSEGFTTGFASLDKYFRLVDGEMITIAGRPSMGKTILGVQIAQQIAEKLQADNDDGCVAIFSAEMTGWSLAHRIAGAMANISVHKLRMGNGTQAEYESLLAMMQKIRTLPIWIDDGSAPTTESMMTQLEQLALDIPVRLMVFDFMELGGDRASSEEQRISSIAIALKDIAKALNIPVIAISQINRGVENRSNKMPALADLRYSGQIEQISDVVLFIMRPEYYIERGMQVDLSSPADREGVAYVSIAKNRHGPPANVRMYFDSEHGKFGDLAFSKQEMA